MIPAFHCWYCGALMHSHNHGGVLPSTEADDTTVSGAHTISTNVTRKESALKLFCGGSCISKHLN